MASECHSYEFQVPANFVLPDFYASASPAMVAEALSIGASLYTTVTSVRASAEIAAIQEAQATELARIRGAAEKQIAELNAAIERAETEHRARTAQLYEAQRSAALAGRKEGEAEALKATEGRIRGLEADLVALREQNRALQERRAVLETARDSDIRVAEERTRASLQIALDEKERAIVRAEKSLTSLQELYARQSDELRELGDLIRRKPNVKNKGAEYESLFREKLIAAYGNGDKFSLSDTHANGVGHAGDYLMNWGEHTVLWEVKNYDRPVPTAEVEKFHRDMKENKHVRIGVMVSRFTGITGHVSRGDRDIEFFEGKMLIYLSNFEAMSDDTLSFLLLLFRMMWENDKDLSEGDMLESTIRQVERLHAAASKARTEWRLHKAHMDAALRWMGEQVEENETRLKQALSVLQGSGKVYDVPASHFKPVDGDEKAAALVQLILEHAEVVKGGVCILNELADIVGSEQGISRDTAKTHIRSVLVDGVFEQAKGKTPARILGLALKDDCVSHN